MSNEAKSQSSRQTLAFRVIHLENLELIAKRGGLHAPSQAPNDGLAYRAIHDQAIQARRGSRAVPCGPGGDIADYVSFYLGARSPMLYRIWKGEVEGYSDGQRPVIYLVTSIERLQELELEFVFTDGHSLAVMTEWFEEPSALADLPWDTIGANFWFDTPEDPDRRRRKQAELLVHRFVPWGAIVGIATIDDEVASDVSERLDRYGLEPPYLKAMPD